MIVEVAHAASSQKAKCGSLFELESIKVLQYASMAIAVSV